MVQVNATERPEVHLKSLKPGTTYTIYVAAVFVSNRTLNSSIVTFNTSTAPESAASELEKLVHVLWVEKGSGVMI